MSRFHYRCNQCGREGFEFDIHNCPATPPPHPGESWQEYKARADSYASTWRKKNNKPTNYHVIRI